MEERNWSKDVPLQSLPAESASQLANAKRQLPNAIKFRRGPLHTILEAKIQVNPRKSTQNPCEFQVTSKCKSNRKSRWNPCWLFLFKSSMTLMSSIRNVKQSMHLALYLFLFCLRSECAMADEYLRRVGTEAVSTLCSRKDWLQSFYVNHFPRKAMHCRGVNA